MSKRENTAYKLSDTFNINTPISSHSIIGLGTLKVNFIIYSIEDTDGNKAFIHQRWKYKMAQCGDRSNQFYLFKSKVHIPFDPVIPLLRIYPTCIPAHVRNEIHIVLFTTAWFAIGKLETTIYIYIKTDLINSSMIHLHGRIPCSHEKGTKSSHYNDMERSPGYTAK